MMSWSQFRSLRNHFFFFFNNIPCEKPKSSKFIKKSSDLMETNGLGRRINFVFIIIKFRTFPCERNKVNFCRSVLWVVLDTRDHHIFLWRIQGFVLSISVVFWNSDYNLSRPFIVNNVQFVIIRKEGYSYFSPSMNAKKFMNKKKNWMNKTYLRQIFSWSE